MEHQETCLRLRAEMPQVHSPRRGALAIHAVPLAAPVAKLLAKPLAKPLVFRKTKRELEREQEKAREEMQQNKKQRRCEATANVALELRCARPKSVRPNPTEKDERAWVAMSLELVVTAAYLSGAVCIVLFTLALGWIVVWKCVLAKMPFVQELFDLKPKKPSTHDEKSISFQDRYQAYKRVRMRLMPAEIGWNAV
ncbi:hypothetical protein BBJ28_00020259 [Nothophytophthora sp. Chile5]|nr:hypothetical protein BBJ28_00020259 [Nothophytophthora sp. Chile5]